MNYLEICKNYFKIFSNKDINKLEELFSDQIVLRDWEINAVGKEAVIDANKKIFKNVKKIKVTPLNLDQISNKIVAELEIIINETDKIYVVDIISFNKEGKIISIKAFKG